MDGTPTALKNGSRKCRSKSSAPLGLVHFRELFFCADRTIEGSMSPAICTPRRVLQAVAEVNFFDGA